MTAADVAIRTTVVPMAVSRFTETDRNGPKRTFVATETDSLSTETDSLGTETDVCEYRNGLCGYRIVIWCIQIDRNTKNRYKLQCQAVQIGYVE